MAVLWRVKAADEECKNVDYVAAETASEAIDIYIDGHDYEPEDIRSVKRVAVDVVNASELSDGKEDA